jgi:SAM-dependent methyltransferase
MRDPSGQIHFAGGFAVRTLRKSISASDFVSHPLARDLSNVGLLVPFDVVDPLTIHSQELGFVSYPDEWTDAQLHAAADLTLEISRQALSSGFELKDASAWNVIFSGTHPVFCDHLSFEAISSREWWAFGQFCRHFTFPLACSRFRGLLACESFRTHRDGLPLERARQLLGVRGRLSRLFPILAVGKPGHQVRGLSGDGNTQAHGTLHSRVYDYCASSLFPGKRGRENGSTHWLNYVSERQHYTTEASEAKAREVSRWLEQLSPAWVVDLGCNTGEFTRLALDAGASVVAVDSDHDSMERIFLSHPESHHLHPVVANLGDLTDGRGWMGAEHSGLLHRMSRNTDLLMMLALTHHLFFSEGIPLREIALLARRITKSWLIVELIDPLDPMVQQLALQRRRSAEDFSIAQQCAAFQEHFDEVERFSFVSTDRHLLLMRKRR